MTKHAVVTQTTAIAVPEELRNLTFKLFDLQEVNTFTGKLACELHVRAVTFLRQLQVANNITFVSDDNFDNQPLLEQFKALLIILGHELFTAKHQWLLAETAAYEKFITKKIKSLVKELLLPRIITHKAELNDMSIKDRIDTLHKLLDIKSIRERMILLNSYLKLKTQVLPHSTLFSAVNLTQKNTVFLDRIMQNLAENIQRIFIEEKKAAAAFIQDIRDIWNAVYFQNDSIEKQFKNFIEDDITSFQFEIWGEVQPFSQKKYNDYFNQAPHLKEKEIAKIKELSEMYIDYNRNFYSLVSKTVAYLQQTALPGLTIGAFAGCYTKTFAVFVEQPMFFLENFLCELYLLQLRYPALNNIPFMELIENNYIPLVNTYHKFLGNNDEFDLKKLIALIDSKHNYQYVRGSLLSLVSESYSVFYNHVKYNPVPVNEMLVVPQKASNENETEELSHDIISFSCRRVNNLANNAYKLIMNGFRHNIVPSHVVLFNKEMLARVEFKKLLLPNKDMSREAAKNIIVEKLKEDLSIAQLSALLFLFEPIIDRHQSVSIPSLFGRLATNSWTDITKNANKKALQTLKTEVDSATDKSSVEQMVTAIDYYSSLNLFNPKTSWGQLIPEPRSSFHSLNQTVVVNYRALYCGSQRRNH